MNRMTIGSASILPALLLLSACSSENSSAPSPSPTASAEPSPAASPTPATTPTPGPTASPTPSVSPTPTPAVSPTPEPVSATDCFNPRLYEKGASYGFSVRLTDAEQRQWHVGYDLQVGEPASFAEYIDDPAAETAGAVEKYPLDTPESIERWHYSRFTGEPAGNGVSVLGEQYAAFAENDGSLAHPYPPIGAPPDHRSLVFYEYDPPLMQQFDLSFGANGEQNYSVERHKSPGILEPADITSVRSTVQFMGKEMVTVPAGTFETCRFDEIRTEDWSYFEAETFNAQISSWIGVGNGLLIRYERDGEIYELINASIDSEPVEGQ